MSAFTGATTAQQIWTKASTLFATKSEPKVGRLKHDLHAVKKGDLSVTEYLARVKRMCDVISTSGHGVSESKQRQAILAGLPVKYESVITHSTYSPLSLSIEKLEEALVDCENWQNKFVTDVPIQANLVQ